MPSLTWNTNTNSYSQLLVNAIHPSLVQIERRQENLIIPALSRIEEKQDLVQAGHMLILKDIHALKAESISTHPSISPAITRKFTCTSLRSSTLVSLFGTASINIRLFATRGNASRYGVLARLRIGNTHALVVEVSGRYFTIPLFFRPGISIALNGIIPDDSPIVQACRAGDSIRVKQLLDDGAARPNDCTPTNQTLLVVFHSFRIIDFIQPLIIIRLLYRVAM